MELKYWTWAGSKLRIYNVPAYVGTYKEFTPWTGADEHSHYTKSG